MGLFGTRTRVNERRRAKRFALGTAGELIACPRDPGTAPIKVHVKDASATGVGVIHDASLAVGQKYVVRERNLAKRKSLLFTVVRSEPLGDGKFIIGLHASHLMGGGYPQPPRASSTAKTAALLVALGLAMGALVLMSMF